MSAVTMDHTGVGVVCLWLSAAMCVVHGDSYYVNVALNKTYNQSSSCCYIGPSSNAANGDTSGVYSYTNCIHTNPINRNPWWEVDLGRTYPVYNMDVWARDGYEYRLYSNISVDGQWCPSITSFPTNTRKKEVTCLTIMYGRTVRVTRLTYTGNNAEGHTLNLCEVQIWDCQAGWYGKQCNTACSTQCKDAVCDRQRGHCTECKPGFYGPSCNVTCQYQCLNNECIKDTGLCEACPENYQGYTCSECTTGFFSQPCVPCPSLCVNNVCDKTTGRCAACPDGYRGETCSECKAGLYGAFCNVSCQYQCLNNECTRDTGLCEACLENYQGNTCSAVTDTTTDNTVVIVGAVLSVIVLILIIIIIVIFVRRGRQHSAKSRAQESNTCNTAQNSGELGQLERAGSSPLSFAPVIATGGRSASTDRGQTSAVSQGTEDGPEHYEPVDMADAENGVHSDDLTATSHKTEADSTNPYDTPAVQYHNTGDVHLYHSWGKPQALQ